MSEDSRGRIHGYLDVVGECELVDWFRNHRYVRKMDILALCLNAESRVKKQDLTGQASCIELTRACDRIPVIGVPHGHRQPHVVTGGTRESLRYYCRSIDPSV